jgi:methionine sulfoxide reductase heme-binding subunit
MLQHRQLIIRLFKTIEVLFIAGLITLIALALTGQIQIFLLIGLAGKLGTLSVILLALSLTPGICRRFGLRLSVVNHLMLFRRHIGILMYLTAAGHALLIFYLPRYRSGTLLAFPESHVFFGTTALLLTTPLFLTANDKAVNTLKKNWGRLHRLVYLVVILVLIHLILMPAADLLALTISTLTLFALLTSFLAKYLRQAHAHQNPAATASPPPPQSNQTTFQSSPS